VLTSDHALNLAILAKVWGEVEVKHTPKNYVMRRASVWEIRLSLSFFSGSRTIGK